jgi:cell division transport system permease protein
MSRSPACSSGASRSIRLLGGLLGTGAALALVWFLQSRHGAVGSEMLSGVALQQRDWFLLLLLPLGFALLATFAARVAVLRALGARCDLALALLW